MEELRRYFKVEKKDDGTLYAHMEGPSLTWGDLNKDPAKVLENTSSVDEQSVRRAMRRIRELKAGKG